MLEAVQLQQQFDVPSELRGLTVIFDAQNSSYLFNFFKNFYNIGWKS